MQFTGFKCDQCGRQKGETNHWFMATIRQNGIMLEMWDDVMVNEFEYKHICGLECAAKFTQIQLDKLNQLTENNKQNENETKSTNYPINSRAINE